MDDCPHTHMTLVYTKRLPGSQHTPPEQLGSAWCDECHEEFAFDDIPDGTMVKEGHHGNYEMWVA